MMVDIVAALTGAAYAPGTPGFLDAPNILGTAATAAPTDEGGNGDFSSMLGIQLALLPQPEMLEEAPLPVDEMLVKSETLDEEHGDEAEVSLMMPPVLPEAAFAPQPLAQLAPDYTVTSDNGDAPEATVRHSAAAEMLRMINHPQAGHEAERPAPPLQANVAPTLFRAAEISAVQSNEGESEIGLVPVDNRAPILPPSASAALAPISLATPAAAAPATSATLPVAYATLEPDVGSPAWQQALGQQLSSFTRNGVHHAELRLHPEELGPLQVNLRLNHDRIQLHFITDHLPVRAALEAAMPQLRTSLAESGIQLDQGSIGSDASGWGAASDSSSGQSSWTQQEGGAAASAETEDDAAPRIIHTRTGISIFA